MVFVRTLMKQKKKLKKNRTFLYEEKIKIMNTKKYMKKSVSLKKINCFSFCNFEKQNIANKMTISDFITSLSFERKNNRSGKILAKKREA